jgi:very-short-patch-repair endonuclease
LVGFTQLLQNFEGLLSEFELAVQQLITEIKLPIHPPLAFGAVSKLLSAAKLIFNHAPFSTSWFDSNRAPAIITCARDAIAKLEAISVMEQSFETRIRADDLLMLLQEIEDVNVLGRNWRIVQERLPADQIVNIDELVRQLNYEREYLSHIDADLKNLAIALQWSHGFTPTISEARIVIEALPVLLTIEAYNGKWADSATRSFVIKRIETVLLDLSEAQELKKELELRFSHRAFLPASRNLIESGKKHASWWKRLFGGYSNYRMEVADLYKTAVPKTNILLSDIQQLATFHKRMAEVNSAYQELQDLLLPGIDPDQIISWQQALSALKVLDGFLIAVPQMASMIPANVVVISVRADDPLILRLTESLKRNTCDKPVTTIESLGIANYPINVALEFVSNLQTAATCCAKAIQKSRTKYMICPDMQQLLTDITIATHYSKQRDVVRSQFYAYAADLPEGIQPFHSESWRKAIDGVESAVKLMKIFGTSAVLKEMVCTPGRLNLEILGKLIQSTELLLQEIDKTWAQQIAFINLTSPGQQAIEARKRMASELRGCVTAAVSEFESISAQLSNLLQVLKPGQSVPLDRLPQDAEKIKELRLAQSTVDRCNSILNRFGIQFSHELSNSDIQLCEWITQASDELINSQLAHAIATCPERRIQVTEILAKAKHASEQMREPGKFFGKIFDPAQNVSSGFVTQDLAFQDFSEKLQHLMNLTDSIDEWIQFNRWREQMSQAGLSSIVAELIHQVYSANDAADAVCAKLYQQLFDHYSENLPYIRDFDGIRHEQIRDQYRALDEWEIKAASARVREFQLTREDRPRIGFLATMTSELGILKRETEKKRRHMPLRKLFNTVPGVLQRLKPCIMMSPLSVSTFLQADTLRFDLVIFDEASQVFPWDAIGAIYRGNQLIVAGDDKQLPPTSFFSRADIESEEEEDDDIGDFESILSLCKSVNMPNKRLRWHYRSRREPLIAFSNKHFYDGDLVTFPSIRDAANDAVQLINVPNGIWVDRKNLPEARRVAELVVEHFRSKPNKSLGVIAFNATQQQAIEDAIYDLRRSSTEVDVLLRAGTHEPLFVKNLENVQGDERDVILLSFGYGKNETGKFIKNFGPLSKPGGERRLNVAVTRAREAVSLVASVRSSDMDLSGSTSVGAQLLKAYLEYAEHGVESLSRAISESQGNYESPFEEEVAAALIRHGIEPVSQVGCGGFRIDLALKHPAHPGLYCLGIECDGATYHSSKTARDRDRIRQSILEGLGWRICRVWSTDWIRNPNLQIQRILSIYNQIVELPPELISSPVTRPEPEFEDLQPKYRAEDTTITPTYLKIEDVPAQHIIDTTLRIVSRVGAIDWSELVSLTSRELGFARTGKKIRERVETILDEEVRKSNLSRIGDRVTISEPRR